jgi:hypothetical protein
MSPVIAPEGEISMDNFKDARMPCQILVLVTKLKMKGQETYTINKDGIHEA